jgi:three-Cys-motif partner protein
LSNKDLHKKPFDETTLAKLTIFEEYAKAWIPTFIMGGSKTICIFDFFAGPGYDLNGTAGSPIRILTIIKLFSGPILQRGTKIKIYFNEYKKSKYNLLVNSCNDFLLNNPEIQNIVEPKYSQEDFNICFQRLFSEISEYPSLVYLDQNGIKYLSNKYLLALEKTQRTDFLYFVSSSYFWRFGDTDEFQDFLNIDLEKAKNDPYNFIHRNLINQLKDGLPSKSQLKLYPFTLKRDANIHGIVFGAKHPRAVEKFLDIAWKINPVNGDANFDIDKDIAKMQGNLFEEKLTKKESFQINLENFIRKRKKVTNAEIYSFTLGNGHPKQQVSEYLKRIRNKKIKYSGHLKINYSAVVSKNNIVEIEWIDNE